MTSIHCTDCPNYDSNHPSECCSNAIRPKSHAIIISKQDERYYNRADEHASVMHNTGLSQPRNTYFEHENWSNC